MKVPFTKMQGAGNDFVVFDCTREPFQLHAAHLKRLSDRRFGIGCDQFLIVEPPHAVGADFDYRIFNADGGEVMACGNGARAFVRFVREKNLTDKNRITVDTKAGRLVLEESANGDIRVDMGVPKHRAAQIPFVTDTQDAAIHRIVIDDVMREISVVNMGNPHAVQIVEDVERAPVTSEGRALETHAQFPERANIGFMQVISANEIKLRVWERGVGETLACGTGACAAVVAGIERGVLRSPVRVRARGGDLEVSWEGRGTSVRLSGPAETVFEGELTID